MVSSPAFFGYIEGMYAVEPGPKYGQLPNTFPGASGPAGPGDGWGGALLLGYRFASPWDMSLGLRYTGLGAGDQAAFPSCGATFTQMTKANIFTLDGDLGYNTASVSSATRWFFGARYFRWHHDLLDTCNRRTNDATTWGVGPRVGFDYSMRFGPSTSLIAGANSSILFGDVKDVTTLGTVTENRTMYQLSGYVGLGWEFAPLWRLAAGYKLDFWSGIHSDQCCGSSTPNIVGGGKGDMLEHGPFARISYNFPTGFGESPVGKGPVVSKY